jgi:hypothetical protein
MDLQLFSNTIGIVAETLLSRADISVADYHCPIHSVVVLCMFDGDPLRAVQKQIGAMSSRIGLLLDAHGGQPDAVLTQSIHKSLRDDHLDDLERDEKCAMDSLRCFDAADNRDPCLRARRKTCATA